MKRIIAIIHTQNDMLENVHKIVNMIVDNNCAEQIYVFTKEEKLEFTFAQIMTSQYCMNVCLPDTCDNTPKTRNWINSYFKTNNFDGFLHVIEDTTDLLKVPTKFMDDLEHMMKTLDYNVWFSTICDPCNFIYFKYNPRLAIILDKVEYFKLELGTKLLFTSHSNTQWVTYDFSQVTEDLLKFDEDFSIAMFYIIEFLARRRNTKRENQLYFMNQYLTVESEYGTFKHIDSKNTEDKTAETTNMQKEDQIFKNKQVKYEPDNNIDLVLETVYKTLNEKL